MPPDPPRNVKLKDPANADLRQSLLGKLGYGVPVHLASFTLEGNASGRLGELFEINHHPDAELQDDGTISQDDIPFEEFSEDFFERLIERWDKGAHDKVSWILINVWRPKKGLAVEVYRDEKGWRYLHVPRRRRNPSRWGLIIRSDAARMRVTNLKGERKARKDLLERLSGRQRRELELTGAFVEVGKSGVHYRISFNRPTIATRLVGVEGRVKEFRFLAALCLHPLGYYSETFTGCLPPSADMLAHLLMIRADEHYYWKKTNHHGLDDPLGGL